jgi:hypothetical protein
MKLSIMATHCCAVPFVLCVIMKPFMLIVIMLTVAILKFVLGLPSGDLFWSFFCSTNKSGFVKVKPIALAIVVLPPYLTAQCLKTFLRL